MDASESVKIPLDKRISSMRAKSSGWAALVQKERQNQQGIEPQLESEPFPPLSLSNALSTKNTDTILEIPFSSVLLPSPNLSSLEQNEYPNNKQSQAGYFNSSKGTKFLKNEDDIDLYQIIKELHSWADESLIKDVMAGVNNEFAQAMKILKDMVSVDQTLVLNDDSETKEPDINKLSNADELSFPCVQNINKEEKDRKGKEVNEDDLSGENVNLEDLNNAMHKCLNISSKNLINYPASCVDKLPGNAPIGFFRFVPIEPELWEEDDIYSFQRKDAIRMMRSAARHSKSASYAYSKGDHLTAQYFSVKAQEEWLAARELNTKAAKEILRLQNSKNDEWTLDLHGLHSTEAVAALEEHLKKIESQVSVNHSVFPRVKGEMETTSHLQHSNCFGSESSTKRLQQPSKQRPSILHVITGKGNHSRGEAALPIVIRSFLADNGYRFDEIRPGVIAVRLKFRSQ